MYNLQPMSIFTDLNMLIYTIFCQTKINPKPKLLFRLHLEVVDLWHFAFCSLIKLYF